MNYSILIVSIQYHLSTYVFGIYYVLNYSTQNHDNKISNQQKTHIKPLFLILVPTINKLVPASIPPRATIGLSAKRHTDSVSLAVGYWPELPSGWRFSGRPIVARLYMHSGFFHVGPIMRDPVFRFSNHVRFNAVYSATEASQNNKNVHIAGIAVMLSSER